MLFNKRYIPPPTSEATYQLCQDLDITIDTRNGRYFGALDLRIQDLPEAARDGCRICNFLWESVNKLCAPLKGFDPFPNEEVFGLGLRAIEGNGPLIINVLTEQSHVFSLEMYLPSGKSSKYPLVEPAREISGLGSSKEIHVNSLAIDEPLYKQPCRLRNTLSLTSPSSGCYEWERTKTTYHESSRAWNVHCFKSLLG